MIIEFQKEYRWLSNFWLVPITINGVTYPSAENAYQASKTLIPEEREYFITCTPGQAKRKSQEITIRDNWDLFKVAIMRDILIQKFKDPEMRAKLIATGAQTIREGNNWNDTFWGVSLRTGKGDNRLGQLIMEIRESLI